ncbi:Uncharacterised protein [Chlamydia trachomatis]|nr:Uncharacterised protein [Chlamydia trachomatis]CRH48727.1 Uncharacterised protein [Chlamydia trachomatis]
MTVQPKRMPANPRGLENELISIAQNRASGISNILLGREGSEMKVL